MDTNTMRFFNRDLSWIDFNERVLEEGLRGDMPPLERFRFLSILSANFDEFFMVRVAAVKRALRSGTGPVSSAETWLGRNPLPDPSGLSPDELLRKIAVKVRSISERQYRCLLNEIFPLLAKGGLELIRPDTYSISHMDYLETFFLGQVYPVLTPLRIEEDGDLPFISGNNLNAAFLLEKEDDDEDEEHIAVIQLPKGLDRIVWLPAEEDSAEIRGGKWALLDDLVLTWGAYLFPGYRVRETMLFKINRDADFSVDEKRDEDFIEAMEEVIEGRTHSPVVRMTYSADSRRLKEELARRLELEEQDLYEAESPMDLGSLMDLANARGFDSLRLKPWKIYSNTAFSEDESLWDRISQRDVLIRLPYESFDPVVRFFQDAAADPQVISIKTALYRTSGNSPIIRALEQAALKGKHVTAVVELKARFDEERNISWANRLEKAGVIVVYGLARLKVHAKISMVIRREKEGVKRYVHLSTGNYNDKTAKLYEDLGIFTAREDIAMDASVFFNMLTGYSAIQSMRKLVIAPTSLKRRLLELIEREAKRSSQEYPGRIIAKVNSLADTDVIEALYGASQAGVKITLVVRGICMLIPGLAGLSENIRVISIIGHYLEHSRIYYFANGGAEEYYLASADWMPRNLERRVELMFPVLQEDIKIQVRDILNAYIRDTIQARLLGSDGSWKRCSQGAKGEETFSVQEHLLSLAAKAGENLWAPRQEFVVRRSDPGKE
ncbi:polyphosphate kinase 1 [Treponema primitia]|uniref:polyphosphate kinase 1 n=1 Tax=Treponema primitia TaxID=88058 RepID=UPI00031FDB51|nr:polyphosphate kinase 1 [Treponema primitia]